MQGKVKFGDFNSLAENVYSGTADFGKMYAKIVSAFSFIIAIVLFVTGIYFIRRPPTFPVAVKFTISTVTPTTVTNFNYDKNGKSTPYTSTVYNLLGTVPSCGTNVITLNNYTNYVTSGQTITAYMHPDCDKFIASQDSDSTEVIGWVLVAIAIGIVIFTILRLFLVGRFKGIAALQGVAGGGKLFKAFL
jgi:hypothetical protein